MIFVFLNWISLTPSLSLRAIVDLSETWHHDYMRLVAQLLLKEMLSRTFFLSGIALLCLLGIQFLLANVVYLQPTIRRSLCFGAVFGGAWTIVRWRLHQGNEILEGAGFPQWTAAIFVGCIAQLILSVCLYHMEQFGLFSSDGSTINWYQSEHVHTLMRTSLDASHMQSAFDSMTSTLHEFSDRSGSRFLLGFFPVPLFIGLLYQHNQEDTWLSLCLTTLVYVMMEIGMRSYG